MRERLHLWGSWAGVSVAVIGGGVLSGWIFDVESLKTVYGPITMKANAAVAFLLSGTALWSLSRGGRMTVAGPASIAAILGGATLMQHLIGWDLGIDQALFSESPGAAATASPNRMGPHAATSLMLAGTALILLLRPTSHAVRTAQALAFAGLAGALLAITGYAYGATELFGIARYTGIALHTAIALFLLHSGILAVGARVGTMAMFADEGIAGTVVRRLALPVVGLPLLLGYIVVLGREQEVYDRGLGIAGFAVTVIMILLATIWHTASVISTADRERQRARDDAERANRLKDEFIAVMSHELRTPLNVMLGRLQILEGDVDRESRIRASRIVARNGRLLARLVEDLLDLSRVTAGQFEIAPAWVHLNAIVSSAVDALAPEAAKKGVELVHDGDVKVGPICVDSYRIHQVVSNLVSNAIKFTPAGGRVDVRTARSADAVTVSVVDTGIGFDREFAPYLFQPFRQADPTVRREHGGLGVGLSIARHLVELHGGSISASSAGPGHGATFVVSLPTTTTSASPQSADRRTAYA